MSHSQRSTTCIEKVTKIGIRMYSQRSSKLGSFLFQTRQADPATAPWTPLTLLPFAQNCHMQSSYGVSSSEENSWSPVGASCGSCAPGTQAVGVRPSTMQQGEDAVPNDHVTKTGKLRDKHQLNSPSRVCLATHKARMGSMKESYTHQGEKSKSLTFTKVRNPCWLRMPLFRS